MVKKKGTMRATAKQRAMIRNSLRLWDHTTDPEYNALSSTAPFFASFLRFFHFPFSISSFPSGETARLDCRNRQFLECLYNARVSDRFATTTM